MPADVRLGLHGTSGDFNTSRVSFNLASQEIREASRKPHNSQDLLRVSRSASNIVGKQVVHCLACIRAYQIIPKIKAHGVDRYRKCGIARYQLVISREQLG